MSTDARSGIATEPDLAGQTALITGAAHGQGRASALALAREGVRIAALDVARPMTYPGYPMGSADDLETLAQECALLGVDCLTFAADVRDDAAVSFAVQSASDRFGAIDILFNNAGICGYGLAHDLTENAWDSMIDINLKGPWIVARRVIPIMIARGEAAKETIEEKCDECEYEEQQIATEELTKPGPPYFTAALSAHPEGELGWAFTASDTYNIPALKTAEQQGRNVKFAGSDGEPAFLEQMLANPEDAKATVWNPFNYAAWAGVDQVLRVHAGLKTWEGYGLPVAFIDDAKTAEAALTAAPDYYSPPAFDYEAMFKKLWSGK